MLLNFGIYPKSVFKLRLLSTALLFALCGGAFASEQHNPFCLPKSKYAPDGYILRMGTEYYRPCRDWSPGGGSFRRFTLEIGPDLRSELFSVYPVSQILVEEILRRDLLSVYTRNRSKSERIKIGNITYDTYASSPLPPANIPNVTVYVYQPETHSPVPEHYVNCAGWARSAVGNPSRCHLTVPNGDVKATVWFHAGAKYGSGFLDHLPDFARYMEQILEIANVTEELDDYRGVVEIVE